MSGYTKQLLLMLICLLPMSSHAELAVIDLGYRSAEELIPALGPLMGPDDVLTGTGYQLIVRTDEQTMSEIRSLLEKLDTRPNNLLITVRKRGDYSASQKGVDTNAGVVITDRNTAVRGSVNVYSDRSRREGYVTQQLRVLEGSQALISAGESTPIRSRQIYRNGRWVTVTDNVEYKDTGNSFYVLPRLQGERVTLEIEPQSSRLLQGQVVEVERAQTTVSGRLGEWISLGQSESSEQQRNSGILSGGTAESSNNVGFEVRVEVIE